MNDPYVRLILKTGPTAATDPSEWLFPTVDYSGEM